MPNSSTQGKRTDIIIPVLFIAFNWIPATLGPILTFGFPHTKAANVGHWLLFMGIMGLHGQISEYFEKRIEVKEPLWLNRYGAKPTLRRMLWGMFVMLPLFLAMSAIVELTTGDSWIGLTEEANVMANDIRMIVKSAAPGE